jgi:hypothetical protein
VATRIFEKCRTRGGPSALRVKKIEVIGRKKLLGQALSLAKMAAPANVRMKAA